MTQPRRSYPGCTGESTCDCPQHQADDEEALTLYMFEVDREPYVGCPFCRVEQPCPDHRTPDRGN